MVLKRRWEKSFMRWDFIKMEDNRKVKRRAKCKSQTEGIPWQNKQILRNRKKYHSYGRVLDAYNPH